MARTVLLLVLLVVAATALADRAVGDDDLGYEMGAMGLAGDEIESTSTTALLESEIDDERDDDDEEEDSEDEDSDDDAGEEDLDSVLTVAQAAEDADQQDMQVDDVEDADDTLEGEDDDEDVSADGETLAENDEDLAEQDDLVAQQKDFVVATCEASTACQQDKLVRLHTAAVLAETARDSCDGSISREFVHAKHAFDQCEKKATAVCHHTRRQCEIARKKALRKRLHSLDNTTTTATTDGVDDVITCPPCVASNCTLILPVDTNSTACSVEKPDLPPAGTTTTTTVDDDSNTNTTTATTSTAADACLGDCEELCPAQRECDIRNRHLVHDFHHALRAHRKHVEACEDSNSDSEESAVDFVDKCQANNERLRATCARTMEQATENSNSTDALAAAASLPCPMQSCVSPPITRGDCSLPVPDAPTLTKCVDLCSSASCAERAKCEVSNDRMLRRESKAARLRFRCHLNNKRAHAKYLEQVQSCAQQRTEHVALCQLHSVEALIALHDKVQQCMSSTPVDNWASKCNTIKPKMPICPPFTCDQQETIGKPPTPVDCNALVAQNVPSAKSALRHCHDTLCAATFYSKFRGEKTLDHDIARFKKTKLFHEYHEYLHHAAKCENAECRILTKRTFRRILINCDVGVDGRMCRRIRRFKAALIRHHVTVIESYEKKMKACEHGKAGRTCRRITVAETRRLMRECPPNQSQHMCARYMRVRAARILRKCGPNGETPLCRRVRRRCVDKYSKYRGTCANNDQACIKHSWTLLQNKCYMKPIIHG